MNKKDFCGCFSTFLNGHSRKYKVFSTLVFIAAIMGCEDMLTSCGLASHTAAGVTEKSVSMVDESSNSVEKSTSSDARNVVINEILSKMAEAKTMGDSIRIALEYQKENYPASQLRDVYKNFMQDFFGPGHILTDTAASAKYLRSELAETTQFDGPDYEPTGFRGNFYRVNIGLIADGTIPYDTFFTTFVNSVQGITPPPTNKDTENQQIGESWMNVWDSIDSQIGKMGWKFENEAADRAYLQEQFSQDNYIVHHSKAYNDAVNFHYRIIARDKFESVILPLLQNRSNPW